MKTKTYQDEIGMNIFEESEMYFNKFNWQAEFGVPTTEEIYNGTDLEEIVLLDEATDAALSKSFYPIKNNKR